ncbi:hypothetical protein [Dyadobacter arcticus]|uniref:Amidohydrolase n=1 Tax=Dyadobacter arcticus TaxID=1078754 RepID=A0ABX0UL64_9BACT|nr:hypothetical protein [Dyadobacter arcticus]NIJ52365.1 hypothetical protein [Dyadobacter arcticus]
MRRKTIFHLIALLLFMMLKKDAFAQQADFIITNGKIFTMPAEQLPATKCVLTMIDGKIVYEQSK